MPNKPYIEKYLREKDYSYMPAFHKISISFKNSRLNSYIKLQKKTPVAETGGG